MKLSHGADRLSALGNFSVPPCLRGDFSWRQLCRGMLALLIALLAVNANPSFAQFDVAVAAQSFGSKNVVTAQPDGTLICEAEEFQVSQPGWTAQNWGQNYFAATFANAFLSRKAFLGAPAQCDELTIATREIDVAKAGRYLALIRYESTYRFETQFRLQVHQNGKLLLDRQYGARDNLKIWAFRQKLKAEVAWSWGAGENVVWEGHDAFVNLKPGKATLTLIAGKQPDNAARRNVDLVMLTGDIEQVESRIEKENYLPLDGMLTQSGDVFLRLHNAKDGSPVTLQIPKCIEHSPYWVHIRNWQPVSLQAEPGQSSEWVEAGSLLDTLNDGQWRLTAKGTGPLHYTIEVGVNVNESDKRTNDPISISRFESRREQLNLAYDANTRYSRRIRTQAEVLYNLVAYLKEHPVKGKPPERTITYALTFNEIPDDPEYTAARNEFLKLMPITETKDADTGTAENPKGYIDVRGLNPERLEARLQELKASGVTEKIACVSLGDEIGLPRPRGMVNEEFHAWLKEQSLKPSDLVSEAGNDWAKVVFSPAKTVAETNTRLFYYSQRYLHHYGIQASKQRTNLVRKYIPNAGIGANFSPHHGYMYLGETHKWIHLFRDSGMTMPWSKDYIWQVPLGTQQMNFINLDLYRAGLRGKPNAKIHYYVMPHTPGQTTANWRRQFYGDLAHGTKIFNLFEFRPVQAAYTENHTSDPEMYVAVRKALYELGTIDDFVQDGQVRSAKTALWFSETGDIWDDNSTPFQAAKRSLYIWIRHQQTPLDFVTGRDAVDGTLRNYDALALSDRHVDRASSKAIAEWVKAGGTLFATAGAGLFDEFNEPNEILRELYGIEPAELEIPEEQQVARIKQDLPFVEPMDHVGFAFPGLDKLKYQIPVIGARSRFQIANIENTKVYGYFSSDMSPALAIRSFGKGKALYCGALPGLAYFKPAIPLRPVDRGAIADSMSHFIPTEFHQMVIEQPPFDKAVANWIESDDDLSERAIICSEPLIETTIIDSPHGMLVPLINWTNSPIKELKVALAHDATLTKVRTASGQPVAVSTTGNTTTVVLDLEVADALVFSKE